MAMITLIAAIGKNGELGKDNDLIWKISEDLKYFKRVTMNKKIIMGKNTFLSLPKLLEGRTHIVLSRSGVSSQDVLVYNNISELIEYLNSIDEEIMVIGGASIYKEFIKIAEKMILTIVDSSSDADVYFPKINEKEWIVEKIFEGKFNEINYSRKIYLKK